MQAGKQDRQLVSEEGFLRPQLLALQKRKDGDDPATIDWL
jgi:hypothetical protein